MAPNKLEISYPVFLQRVTIVFWAGQFFSLSTLPSIAGLSVHSGQACYKAVSIPSSPQARNACGLFYHCDTPKPPLIFPDMLSMHTNLNWKLLD